MGSLKLPSRTPHLRSSNSGWGIGTEQAPTFLRWRRDWTAHSERDKPDQDYDKREYRQMHIEGDFRRTRYMNLFVGNRRGKEAMTVTTTVPMYLDGRNVTQVDFDSLQPEGDYENYSCCIAYRDLLRQRFRPHLRCLFQRRGYAE